jgi:hypothetical protein
LSAMDIARILRAAEQPQNPHPEERPLGRVSKDQAPIALMVRDARQERAPHHEDFN